MAAANILGALDALDTADQNTTIGFLFAAVYAIAMNDDVPPRVVADRLWKALPADSAWPPMERSLRER